MSNTTPEKMQKYAILIVEQLQQAGFTTYFAGGSVRDALLGKDPVDYDIATGATPEQVMAIFPKSINVGKSFGVSRVPIHNTWFEVATFRTDSAYHNGRHPTSVTYSTPEEDAQRRDFTVNAIFFDPISKKIHDYVNGRQDIENKIIRCVGNPIERFEEDHLRMLRAVRFTSVLSFTMEKETADAIRATAASILKISPERIRDELTRILVESPKSGDAIILLDNVKLLEQILPEIKAMQGQKQPPQFHPEGDVFEHTVLMLNLMTKKDKLLAFSVLLHDVGKPGTAIVAPDRIRFNGHASLGAKLSKEILKRLKFSNQDQEDISTCVGGHMRYMEVKNMKQSTLRRLVGATTYPTEVELHRLDCLGSHGGLENYEHVKAFEEKIKNEPILPKPWINGHDIINLGITKGHKIGKIHKQAYEAQLNGDFQSKEDLYAWLKEQYLPTRAK